MFVSERFRIFVSAWSAFFTVQKPVKITNLARKKKVSSLKLLQFLSVYWMKNSCIYVTSQFITLQTRARTLSLNIKTWICFLWHDCSQLRSSLWKHCSGQQMVSLFETISWVIQSCRSARRRQRCVACLSYVAGFLQYRAASFVLLIGNAWLEVKLQGLFDFLFLLICKGWCRLTQKARFVWPFGFWELNIFSFLQLSVSLSEGKDEAYRNCAYLSENIIEKMHSWSSMI